MPILTSTADQMFMLLIIENKQKYFCFVRNKILFIHSNGWYDYKSACLLLKVDTNHFVCLKMNKQITWFIFVCLL